MASNSDVNRKVFQQAAEWCVELNAESADLETRQRFDSWLRGSPEHVRAFLEALSIWEDAQRLPLNAGTTPEQLLAWARTTDNVVRIEMADSERKKGTDLLFETGSRQPQRTEAVPFLQFTRPLLIATAAVVACVAILWNYQRIRYPTYVSAIGEQRSLVLPDNSTVELNTNSAIRVRFTDNERTVQLLRGQALFHVAKNPARPFLVHADDTRVRAVGTEFDVYKKAGSTIVTVVEGRVAVYSSSTIVRDGNVFLAAGERLTMSGHQASAVEHPSLAGATAWMRRQLVFDTASLPDVADEFNRYNTRRLVIDASLDSFRISGIFSSRDPASLIRFLREQPGVTVEEMEDEIRVSRH
jgi:transmembrane sensor